MVAEFRNYEEDPLDIDSEKDLVQLINVVVGHKIKRGYFKRWHTDALLSEGWIQIQLLIKSWDASKGISFPVYCFKYLGGRISDGMSSFEAGMRRNFNAKEKGRYSYWMTQFPEGDLRHLNECGGATSNNLVEKDTLREHIVSNPDLTENERFIVNMLAKGTTMKTIGNLMGVSESRISQRCKIIRRKINE